MIHHKDSLLKALERRSVLELAHICSITQHSRLKPSTTHRQASGRNNIVARYGMLHILTTYICSISCPKVYWYHEAPQYAFTATIRYNNDIATCPSTQMYQQEKASTNLHLHKWHPQRLGSNRVHYKIANLIHRSTYLICQRLGVLTQTGRHQGKQLFEYESCHRHTA